MRRALRQRRSALVTLILVLLYASALGWGYSKERRGQYVAEMHSHAAAAVTVGLLSPYRAAHADTWYRPTPWLIEALVIWSTVGVVWVLLNRARSRPGSEAAITLLVALGVGVIICSSYQAVRSDLDCPNCSTRMINFYIQKEGWWCTTEGCHHIEWRPIRK